MRFSQRFYAALTRGDTVAAAVTRGRNAIRSLPDESARTELITPVLYSTGKAQRIANVAPPPEAAATVASSRSYGWRERFGEALPTMNHIAGIVSSRGHPRALFRVAAIGTRPRGGGRDRGRVAGVKTRGRNLPPCK